MTGQPWRDPVARLPADGLPRQAEQLRNLPRHGHRVDRRPTTRSRRARWCRPTSRSMRPTPQRSPAATATPAMAKALAQHGQHDRHRDDAVRGGLRELPRLVAGQVAHDHQRWRDQRDAHGCATQPAAARGRRVLRGLPRPRPRLRHGEGPQVGPMTQEEGRRCRSFLPLHARPGGAASGFFTAARVDHADADGFRSSLSPALRWLLGSRRSRRTHAKAAAPQPSADASQASAPAASAKLVDINKARAAAN